MIRKDAGEQLRTVERMLKNEVVFNTAMICNYCINQCSRWEAMVIVNMTYNLLQGKGTADDYANLACVTQYFQQQKQQDAPQPLANTLLPSPMDLLEESATVLPPDMQLLSTIPLLPSTSKMDGIFHDAIDVQKVLAAFPGLISDKVDGIKRWFVIHKVLEEINWLVDRADSHFIMWVKDHNGWAWSTLDFKRVLPEFKRKSTMEWGPDTVKDVLTGCSYRDFADKVRNCFVTIMDGRIVDKTYYFRRPDLFIYHPGDHQ